MPDDYPKEELIGAGEPFLTDMEAYKRKTREDRIKIWKHRAGVIFRVVVEPAIPYLLFWAGFAAVVIPSIFLFSWLAAKLGALAALATMLLVVLFCLIGVSTIAWLMEHIITPIRQDWDPPTNLDT